MKIICSLCIVVVIVLLLTLVWVWSGVYNVAASKPHMAITRFSLSHIMDSSVKYHARKITVPNLSVVANQQDGYHRYNKMCVFCHGAPGVQPGNVGKGLLPDPPDLSEAIKDWKPNQAFWIIDNGIKMTGMPSFGKTVPDSVIWNTVSFLYLLPKMSAKQYQSFSSGAVSGLK